ncbi:BTB/POZ domain-containing protein 7-like [Uloborus diversus]|uniref:BTB/POZ domain-containing protein 7-like n=1 Tax=Uloborus diversus TaxID=327109 RepID=UPI00240A7BAC|nr:BTB/POZ domain-containing protein 7-like [Uloborus diversus]XP_054715063.1 BTB/POZ domain-containing protein 7-like [Uloborus diversus]
MGVSASSPASCSNTQNEPMASTLQAQSVCTSFSSGNVDQYGKEKKRKVGSLSTLRKRFTRRRRTSKGFDHAQVFREFIADWSPRDVVALVEEYESTSALKEITLQAEMARPPASSCKQDLGLLFENKYCSDINLIYQGTVFAVHRAILAARCPFFREMLNSLSSICTEVAVDIDIAGVSISMFNELLRYLYTGELSVSESYGGNFDILFQLSEQFGIPNPLEQDLKYLLETGIYSDISLSFTSPSDTGHTIMRGQTYICDHILTDGEGKPCKICHGTNEFWCHRAILSARSPFFRNVIHRQQRRSADMHETHRTRILLDDSIIPRRYACILLRAVYQDALEFGAVLPDSTKRGSMPDVHVPQSSVEEAMQLFEVARFIEMDALVQSCEDFIVESISLDSLLPVLRWSSQPHGSQWVYRQAVHFMREEFVAVSSSPVLFQLDKSHLIDVIKSDFLQAGELEVLQAVLKWGEHQLFKRVEEREPNLVSHTAHSVSRRGLRRRDLSDVELRDLLSDLLSCVRISHVLPPDSEALVSAVRRGLISTPPSYMLGDDLCVVGHSSNLKTKAWIRGRNSHGLYVKPRLFTPFVEEAKAWLEEQLGQDTEVVRQQVWHISHIPDTLYMVEKPLSFSEGVVPLGHLCPLSSLEFMKDVVLDETTLRQMKKREKELRQSQSARRAYTVVRNHCDVTKLLQLRVVREFGLPDKVMEVLHRTSYQFLEEYSAEHHPSAASVSSSHQSRYPGDHSSHVYGLPRMYKPSRHLSLELGEAREEPLPPTNQMSRSCCSDHLNEIIPDIAMPTSLLEQIHISESETSPDSGGFSLRMF